MAAHNPDLLSPTYTRDEQARKGFVSSLRSHVLGHQAQLMRQRYDEEVVPAFEKAHGRPPETSMEVRQQMREQRQFRFYSAVRTNAQEMVFGSVIPAIEREMSQLAQNAKGLAEDEHGPGGTLQLDPTVDVPRYMSEIDIHLAPGAYHAEYGEHDVAAGVQYDNATRVFAFRQFGDELNDIGMTMSNYVRLRYPELNPEKILDCGCTAGHNTLPWAQTFPDAEVYGIDVAPGILRYANARAQNLGVKTHFRQMDATHLQYPDNSFDVVFSSMFLHELPVKHIKAYIAEARRVLKPGGILLNMELPPNRSLDAYQGFYFDWDTYYNNEASMKPFRDQNYRDLCLAGGFSTEDFIDVTLPRYTFVGEEVFVNSIDAPTTFDSHTGRMNAKATRWYAFGAIKG